MPSPVPLPPSLVLALVLAKLWDCSLSAQTAAGSNACWPDSSTPRRTASIFWVDTEVIYAATAHGTVCLLLSPEAW